MNRKRWIRPAVTGVFYLALTVFLVVFLLNIDYASLSELRLDIRWVAISVVLGLTFRYWQVFIWITVLRGLGATDVRMNAELSEIYAKSWLGRYIPGTAPWILGKIYFASQHGISKSRLAVASLLEGAVQIVVLLGLSSAMLLFDSRLNILGDSVRLLMIAAIAACLVALIPSVFNWWVGLAFKLLRRGHLAEQNRVRGKTILIAAGQYLVGAVIAGASLYFVVKSVFPQLGFEDFSFVVAASNLASATSMLAFFAPGGIGVREGVQLALLSLIIPGAIALVAVVFTRIWSVSVDLLFWAISRGWRGVSRRRKSP